MFEHPKWRSYSTSTSVNPPPKSLGLCESSIESQRLVYDLFGHLIKMSSEVRGMPVSQAFTGFAYLRKIAEHRRRVQREMRKTNKTFRQMYQTHTSDKSVTKLPSTFKVVNCAGCKKLLLGESMESVREQAIEKGSVLAKRLPPPVHLRHNDRPYCKSCVLEERHRA